MTYNDYIFDKKNNRFIGDFEGAYKNCDTVYKEQFDCSRFKFNIIRNWLQDKPNTRVLDIGAGFGCFVNELHRSGRDVLGLEISSSAVQKGKDMYGLGLPLAVGDVTTSIQCDSKFDIVICYGVLGFLMDKIDMCLNNINSCLSKNGKVAFSVGFSEKHKISRDILKDETSFVNILSQYFKIKDFIVHYLDAEQEEPFKLGQARDLIVLGEKK